MTTREPTTSRLRVVLRIAAVLLTIAMVVVIVQAFRRDGPEALDAWRAAQIRWTWIGASIVCAFAGHAVYVYGWRRLLGDAYIRASYWRLACIFLVSNLGRYLPAGKAWQMAIVGIMAKESNLPAGMLAATSLFQGIVGVGVGMIVLFIAGGTALGIPSAWMVLAVTGVVVLLLLPRLLRMVPRLHDVVARRVNGIDSVTTATMWTLIWTAAASWTLWGIALDALAHGLLATVTASASAFVAAWTGSFLAGLVAFVSPAGLVAREGTMKVVLTSEQMPVAEVLMIVVVARVWVTVLDVAPAALVLTFRNRFWRPQSVDE